MARADPRRSRAHRRPLDQERIANAVPRDFVRGRRCAQGGTRREEGRPPARRRRRCHRGVVDRRGGTCWPGPGASCSRWAAATGSARGRGQRRQSGRLLDGPDGRSLRDRRDQRRVRHATGCSSRPSTRSRPTPARRRRTAAGPRSGWPSTTSSRRPGRSTTRRSRTTGRWPSSGPAASPASAQLDATVGVAIPIALSGVATGNKLYAFGYPAAGKYHGSDLVYCAGNDHPGQPARRT